MGRILKQIHQVLLVYATRPRTWFWAGIVTLFFGSLLLIRSDKGRIDGPHDAASPELWLISFMYCLWLVVLLEDQTKVQFSHYRARVVPGFALPHLCVSSAIALLAGLILPAIVALAWESPPLPLIAYSSLLVSVLLLLQLYQAWFFSWIIILGLFVPRYFGYDVLESRFEIPLAACLVMLIVAWAGIVYYMFRLATLREEEPFYERARDETQKVRSDGSTGLTRAQFKRLGRWWFISDRWHAHLGGFHHDAPARVIRLLRYGFGSQPVELTALWYSLAILAFVLFATPPREEIEYPFSSPHLGLLLLPAISVSLAPMVLGGGALEKRRPRLANELLFPLTRCQLVRYLFLAAAWNSAIFWGLGCVAGAAILLITLPIEALSFPLIATAFVLCTACAIAAFGLSLYFIMWEEVVPRIVFLSFVVGGNLTLLLSWWTMRKDTGDSAWCLVAMIILGLGILMIRNAFKTWQKLELG